MLYEQISDLPATVQDSLPEQAQEIYRQAYNRAYRMYANPWSRRGAASQAEIANKIAWRAVKEKYQKDNGQWVRRPNWT
jgi:cation transport regulator